MYPMLNASEMEALYNFVFEENQKGNNIKIVGFDVSFSSSTYAKILQDYSLCRGVFSTKEYKHFSKNLKKASYSNIRVLFFK